MEHEEVCLRLSIMLHDSAIWDSYKKEKDVHGIMTKLLLPSIVAITDEYRRIVKTINVYMVCGGWEGMFDEFDEQRVREFIGVYRDQWPTTRKLLSRLLEKYYE